MKKLIYSDEKYIETTKAELQQAKEAAQKMLDVWNELNIGPLKNPLFELAHVPQRVHSAAVSKDDTEPVTHGRFQVRPGVSLTLTEVPCPDALFRAAHACRMQIQIGRPELWSIENDKTVVLNEALADELLHANDIYAENAAQAQFATLCVKYVEYSNALNEALKNIQTMRMPAVPFSLASRSFPLIAELQFYPDQVREIIKEM